MDLIVFVETISFFVVGYNLKQAHNCALTHTHTHQGGSGHWTVNYTGTQSLMNISFYLLAKKFWTFINQCF